MPLPNIIRKLKSKADLNKEDLYLLFNTFEMKDYSDSEVEDLIVSWNKKGQTPEELKLLSEEIFSRQSQITKYYDSIDICGTGGDKLNTFNISTISAIVLSSMGLKVIKHSGRSTTSLTGSVDIINSFNIDIDSPDSEKKLENYGLMFSASKKLRETFSIVKQICKKIDSPGFVNLLGPLTNPYKTRYHIIGVSRPEWGELMSRSLLLLDAECKALIIQTKINENTYLDELSLCGENYIWELNNGSINKTAFSSKSLDEKIIDINNLKVKNEMIAKEVFIKVLQGHSEYITHVKTTALNCGAGLYLTNKEKSIKNGYITALKHIETGKAWEHFQLFSNS